MRRATTVKRKGPQAFPLELSDDLAVDLEALSEAHYGAPKAGLIREAIKRFIEAELTADHVLRQRFADAKARVAKPTAETIRLVDAAHKPKE